MGEHEFFAQVDQDDVVGLTAALDAKVPTTQRGLIGGASSSSGSGAWTPNAAAASEHRRTVTGATTVNLPSGGVDTQLLRLWFLASGADRAITFDAGYEVSQPVPGRAFTVPAGTWGEVLAANRDGTWVLLAAYPQTIALGPQGGVGLSTYGASTVPLPTTFEQLRWTLNGDITVNLPSGGSPADGQRVLVEAYANGAMRTVTFAAGFETSSAAPARAFPIPSGTWGYFTLIHRNGAWRLVAADPVVVTAAQGLAYAATVTVDASTGSNFTLIATGNLTLAAPTNGVNGQMLLVAVTASGGNRTVTFSDITLTTGTTSPFTVDSGKTGYFGLRNSGGSSWALLAQKQDQ